jgi:hypothetical protein
MNQPIIQSIKSGHKIVEAKGFPVVTDLLQE